MKSASTGGSKMTKAPTCKHTGVTLHEPVGASDNSCSRFFLEWIVKDVPVLQLPMQDGTRCTTHKYEHWNFVVGGISVFAFCYVFYIWFSKYRLRYLLRLSLTVFFFFLLLNCSCSSGSHFQDWLEEDTEFFCSEKHFNRSSAVWLTGLLTAFMIFVRYHWSLPFNIKRKLHHIGLGDAKHLSKAKRKTIKQLTNEKFHALPHEMPPVFPNGWIPILESTELSVGCSTTVAAIGRKFCVFRGFEGKAYILDAYCPHLGAELAAGGRVRNECIECPFHEWRFDGRNGHCLKIPYAQKVPEIAKIKTWPSCEKNGFIFVWHHAENESPSWEMPSLENVESGHWKFRGRTDHEVHCHIQEIPENGADIAHLHVVHSKSVFLGQHKLCYIADSFLNCIEHEWQPGGWAPDVSRSYIGKVKLSQRMRVCGISLPFFRLNVDIEQIGPATVHLHMETCFGRAVLLQHIIPEGPLNHRIIHTLYTESRFKQFSADLFILSEAVMLERDISIWNHKRYLKKPILVKEDKMINLFRRWYSQFYSEHSPTLKDFKERTLDW